MLVAQIFHRPYILLIVLLGLLQTKKTLSLKITEWNDTLSVTVSRGAHISAVDDAILYTEEEYLLFLLPDIPDPPVISSTACHGNQEPKSEACELYAGLQNGMTDIADIMVVMNKILTTKGLKKMALHEDLKLPPKWINRIMGVETKSSQPSDELRKVVGGEWLSDMEARLLLRKLQGVDHTPLTKRERRWGQLVLSPVLKLLKSHGFRKTIGKVFDYLFAGNNEILNYITGYKALSEDDKIVFTQLPEQVSEFEVETRRLFIEMLNSTDSVKSLAAKMQRDIEMHESKLSTIQDTFLLEQKTMSDIIRFLYLTNVYLVHLAAYDECRSNHLSPIFVPPELLKKRLMEVASALPPDMQLSIPAEEYQKYYKLAKTDCIYDSSGGLIRVSVPLMKKPSAFILYEFKALQFAYGDSTCALDNPSGYIIKDVVTNMVHSVSEVDFGECNPRRTGYCKIPLETMDDSLNFCATVLLTGQTAEQVRNSCKMRCFENTKAVISQLTPSTFIGIHLTEAVNIVCPGKTMQFPEKVPYGAVKIKVPHGCSLEMNGNSVGKSTSNKIDDISVPGFQVMLPVQFTTLQDYLPFVESGDSEAVFSHAAEIINLDFKTSTLVTANTVLTPYQVVGYFWSSMHSLLLAYLYFKTNLPRPTAFANAAAIPMVHATTGHACKLPVEAYALLYVILALCTISILPALLVRLYRGFSRLFSRQVEIRAQRLAMDHVGEALQNVDL